MATITSLPPAPSRADPTNFAARGDALLGALDQFVTETNAVAAEVITNKDTSITQAAAAATSASSAATQVTLATTQANNAAANAAAAAASAGASLWVSGSTYSIGDARYSPANQRVYRRITSGTGTTDPSLDGTNWKAVDVDPTVVVVASTSQAAVAFTHYILTNVAATTVTLPASPAVGDTVWVTPDNGLATNLVNFNGQNHQNVTWATDPTMTLDNAQPTYQFRFANSKWRLI